MVSKQFKVNNVKDLNKLTVGGSDLVFVPISESKRTNLDEFMGGVSDLNWMFVTEGILVEADKWRVLESGWSDWSE